MMDTCSNVVYDSLGILGMDHEGWIFHHHTTSTQSS